MKHFDFELGKTQINDIALILPGLLCSLLSAIRYFRLLIIWGRTSVLEKKKNTYRFELKQTETRSVSAVFRFVS